LAALKRAVRLAPESPGLHFQIAHAFVSLGRDHQALRSFRRAVELDPQHEAARFWSDTLQGRTPPTPPTDAVVKLFDEFASDYDNQMVGWLNYSGPALLWRAVRRVMERQGREPRGLDVVDAGCGTGLAARVLKSASRRLVGVDLSPGMLEKAAARHVYDELVVGDLAAFLASRDRQFDLVFSADVFIYVGDLSGPFRAASSAVKAGGLVAFTLEACEGEGYAVTRAGRYAHSLSYTRRTAADCGFQLRHAGTGTLRFERGRPVSALVTVLQK
jgi:predicted TPR repeat methyltransferase